MFILSIVLVRRNVIHHLLPVPQLQTSYALGVEICIERQPTRVFAFNKPPQNRLAVADVHTLLDSPLPTIVAGDFNAKHTAWNSNIVGPDAHMPDVLDIAVTRGLAAAPSLDVLDDHLISDHQAVLSTLKTTPMTTSLPSPKHRQDWRIFAEHMAEHSPSFKVESPADVDRLATDLSATQSNVLRESRLYAASTRRQPQLPAYIEAMIEEKRKLRRQWQNLRCPIMKTRLNSLAAKISDALVTVADESWHSAIERAGDDWSGMYRLCRLLSGKPSPIRPLMASDGTPRYRAEDQAEIFADYLETQFRPNPTSDVQHVETIKRHLKNYFESPIVPTEDPVVVAYDAQIAYFINE
ncbi:unnamed protein product [Leptidea sinapis]|uniref:Endonuclease/exonuclease/phosphatase domain-containing protein n=1 Tax=Leptidea sinapis TaxID=189913 RepID=A0A5E4QD01_9NEOP|nr:unnamed protein product [Leptidea sinapis]